MKRCALAIIVVFSFSAAVSAATPEALFAAGKQAMTRGDAEAAVDLFEQAIEQRPNDANYHLWLANAYGTSARKTSNIFKQASLARKAKASLERAVEIDPNNLEARFGLLNFYQVAPGIMGGSDARARVQALEIRKRDSLAGHRAFAAIYARDKNLAAAHKELEDAIREQPKAAKPHYFYAVQLASEKNYKDAFEHFEAAERLDPSFMPTYFRLGWLAVQSGSNYGRGEEAMRKYLAYSPTEEEPSHARTWYWLGQLYEKLGKKAEARQSYQASLKLAPGTKEVIDALKRVS